MTDAPDPTESGEPTGLSDDARALIDLESRTFRSVGAKEKRIRDELGLTSIQYHVRLNRLLDDPAALAYAPGLINRLRERRR
ncbi:DUF3263 domain-containing protein [Helcobacillus massiliensis]|uniref:DUF3263 domain-containing protein n=1 Tax=Helcobacillus massiliensis TaxID=521392 RepID=UPI0025544AAB|nr:DUF3263 domain-containing protein [Helcobacillus massiliensis]MDK7742440.1 DUF3263 domain-containing protein [Helcobacillus massiliensis]WOO92473.1 DUF3263 domain-containing protein [Helcobacillus massiliensis]